MNLRPRLVFVGRTLDGTSWGFDPGGGCGFRAGFETEEAAKAVASRIAGPDPDFSVSVCSTCGERGGKTFPVTSGSSWPPVYFCAGCKP